MSLLNLAPNPSASHDSADMHQALRFYRAIEAPILSSPLRTRIVWLLLFCLGLLSGWSLESSGISLAPGTLPGVGLPVLGLLALSYIYRRFRPDPRIAALAHMAAVTLVFTTVAAILSYTVIALWHPPLIDGTLVAADRMLGLDWLAAYRWVMAHHAVHLLFHVTYYTLIPQMVFLLVILNFLGRIERCWELMGLFIVSCLGCLILSALWPAVGAFGYFHVRPDEPYLQIFQDLRNHTLTTIDHDKVQGIITFPSLHATLAMLFAYAVRGIRILFPVFIVLNALVFMATPFIGGHHFADLWGGVGLTLLTVAVVRLMQHKSISA
ncbi:MAG: hypothetical protein JWO78_2484 [Micavibrio sp.]|nr:hypothetical protein [Micavibrio sp.]